MPPLEASDRYQDALLWKALAPDKFAAQPVEQPPDEIDVRFIGKPGIVMDSKGNTIKVDATAVLDEYQRVANGDVLWVGCWTDAWPPVPTSGLMRVVAVNQTYSICRKFRRSTIGLMRFNGSLPLQS